MTRLYSGGRNSGSGEPRIKVAHLISGLPVGGAQTALRYLVERANRAFFEMNVISMTSLGPVGTEILRQGVEVTALEMRRSLPDPTAVVRLVLELRRRKIDILQCWMYHADLFGGLAALAAPRTKVFWNLRQTNLDPRHSKLLTRSIATICAKSSRRLPHTIVCGSKAAEEIHVAMGYAAHKMVLIENGVDTQRFAPSADAKSALREKLHLDSRTLLVGLIARFHPQKDHRTFVQMAEILRRRGENVAFILCGENVDTKNEELVRWIREASIQEYTHLLGRRTDVEAITAALDVSVSCSASAEGGANTLIEAIASGVPCVATDVGDARRIVGEAGFVVAPGNAEALAEATARVLHHPQRTALGELARHRAEEIFDIDKVVRRYEDLYRLATTQGSNRNREAPHSGFPGP